jgi:hypothetical protein
MLGRNGRHLKPHPRINLHQRENLRIEFELKGGGGGGVRTLDAQFVADAKYEVAGKPAARKVQRQG